MKPLRLLSLSLPACTLLVFVGLLTNACASSATNAPVAVNTNSVASTAPVTNSISTDTNMGPAELAVPVAVFELAAKPTHDPFFPNSLRQPVQTATNAPAFSAAVFTLKGLSGSFGRRLALINNRTVAAGEDAEITTATGKIKIQCVEIRESSVIIRAESQTDPIEVFLRKSAQ